jgi:hypothetical protein
MGGTRIEGAPYLALLRDAGRKPIVRKRFKPRSMAGQTDPPPHLAKKREIWGTLCFWFRLGLGDGDQGFGLLGFAPVGGRYTFPGAEGADEGIRILVSEKIGGLI